LTRLTTGSSAGTTLQRPPLAPLRGEPRHAAVGAPAPAHPPLPCVGSPDYFYADDYLAYDPAD
jgi:hypothetical protein